MQKQGITMKHFFIYLFLTASLIASDSPRASVVRTDHGFIDYANRLIVSRGTASVFSRSSSQSDLKIDEKNLKLSKGEARSQARENLLDLVMLVNFDG